MLTGCLAKRRWKQTTEQRLVRLEQTEQRVTELEQRLAALSNRTGSTSTSPPVWLSSPGQREANTEYLPSLSGTASAGSQGALPDWTIVVDLDTSPGALPGHYILSTASSGRPELRRQDIIARGAISLEESTTYCNAYQNQLDHFLYGILTRHHGAPADMPRLRRDAPGLWIAVCSVGALYCASPNFELLYQDFVAFSAGLTFAKRSTIEDVRALCIGAFWLGDLSWSLVGIAVRLATEVQLHKSFQKALEGDYEQYLRARLYFLVYICDHHFSIPYGRPPLTRECEGVRDARKFLDCEHATEADTRLVSQVLRWSICSNIYDTFGANVDRPISEAEIPSIRRFSIALDSLRAEWADRFNTDAYVGNYPRKGASLQYHFAKLYLGSHALRGRGSDRAKGTGLGEASDTDELANSAVFSATSILRTVVSDNEIQSYLSGIPTYFHTMITFATVFLLKVSTRFSTLGHLDMQEVQQLLLALVAVMKQVTGTMHPHHLLVKITKGLDEVVQKSGRVQVPAVAPNPTDSLLMGSDQLITQPPIAPEDFFFSDGMFDQSLMSDYDMLMGQHQGL